MATCLSQLYHESKRGVKAGYAKFETFPIWNLPLNHPVNLAYEAATADLNDVNMIDPFHLEAYNETTVNYNRDVEVFPVLKAMFEKIQGTSPYQSPTDMGVNMAGYGIVDDDACCHASKQEIIRRYYEALVAKRKGEGSDSAVQRLELLMEKAGISVSDRPVVAAANVKDEKTGAPAAAIELADGTIITGKTSSRLGASSAMMLNTLKHFSGIDDAIELMSPEVLTPIMNLKVNYLGDHNPLLHLDELLIALAMESVHNENAKKAYACLPMLAGLEAHSSVILSSVDVGVFKKLGINLTCEPRYEGNKLYHN